MLDLTKAAQDLCYECVYYICRHCLYATDMSCDHCGNCYEFDEKDLGAAWTVVLKAYLDRRAQCKQR